MIAEKIARQAARRNAAMEGKAAPDVELEAAIAFQRSTRRVAAPIARQIGCPEKTVQDWGNVNSADRGPHLTLLFVLQLAQKMRPDEERSEVFSALDFIERHMGRVAFELPKVTPVTPAERAHQVGFLLIQLGEFLEIASQEEIPPAQLTRLHQEKQELWEAIEKVFPSAPDPTGPEPGSNVTPMRSSR